MVYREMFYVQWTWRGVTDHKPCNSNLIIMHSLLGLVHRLCVLSLHIYWILHKYEVHLTRLFTNSIERETKSMLRSCSCYIKARVIHDDAQSNCHYHVACWNHIWSKLYPYVISFINVSTSHTHSLILWLWWAIWWYSMPCQREIFYILLMKMLCRTLEER